MSRSSGRMRGLAVALLALAAGAGVVAASAASIGGLSTADLGAADATPSTIPALVVTWVPRVDGAEIVIDGARIAVADGRFAAGDSLRLALDFGTGLAPCEAVASIPSETDRVDLSAAAFAGCPTRRIDRVQRVAASLTGSTAASSTSGDLGPVRSRVFAAAGAFLDTTQRLQASLTSSDVAGTAFASLLVIDLPAASGTAALTGTRASLALADAAGSALAAYDGTVSSASGDPIRVVVDPLGLGHGYPSIVIDLRAGREQSAWLRASSVASLAFAMTAPQRLEPASSRASTSVLRGAITASTPTAPALTALDPIDPAPGLRYTMPADELNQANGLGFCHSFTITNTTSKPIQWSLAFDTSRPPMYGLDPTKAGALSSSWGFATSSYDAATHRWVIAGTGQARVLQPGESREGGYCAQNVPVPPIDPSGYTVAVSIDPASGPYYVALRISVTSTSRWAVPWQADVDLGQLVCAASLAGHPLAFSRATGTPLGGDRYRIIGADGDTRLVSATQPRDFVFASYSPDGPSWSLPCRS